MVLAAGEEVLRASVIPFALDPGFFFFLIRDFERERQEIITAKFFFKITNGFEGRFLR
ncbi:MAG: hypothetical protein BWY42_01597 [Candidatus Omnitrophica bacterium ADurb.Bin277]|nr:MAG: hypothetical protein BWY42_01597 [Candidatus Omnitrophica bacterium ADurb.Bin277]